MNYMEIEGLNINIERIKILYELCQTIEAELVHDNVYREPEKSELFITIINSHMELLEEKFQTSEDMQPQCKVGCSFCCYQDVDILDVEMKAISSYVSRVFTDKQKRELSDRHQRLETIKASNPSTERIDLREPCSFLVNNRCSIYNVRPFSCRGYTSNKPDLCEDALNAPVPSKEKIYVLSTPFELYQEIIAAISLLNNDLGKTLEDCIPKILS